MVAHSAPRAFAPEEPARIAVAADGSLAAIVESGRVVVVDVPDGAVQAEIGLDANAETTDVAWIAAPPRIVVLSRHAAHSTVHVLEPAGPRSLTEIRLPTPMRLVAAVGNHALVVGSVGAAVLTLADDRLVPYQFQSRATPSLAGTAGAMFVVALTGTIEEWDPISRMPKRRLRLPRAVPITALGGSDRLVWMTTQQEPARIEVLPLVNRGQPKGHDLPESITAIAGHPSSDLIACIAGGRLYTVDLDGRARLRTIAVEGIDRVDAAAVVIGRVSGVLAAQARRPLTFIRLDTREAEPAASQPTHGRRLGDDEPARRSSLVDPEEPKHEPTKTSTLGDRRLGIAVDPPAPVPAPPPIPSTSPEEPSEEPPEPQPMTWSTGSLLVERFAAMRKPHPDKAPNRASWRDDTVLWVRAILAGTDKAAPIAPPIETLAARFEIAPLTPALVLLYGAHLGGQHGVAPVDISRVLGRSWDDALGRGPLASLGFAVYQQSRVILAPPIQRALDELPPRTGTLVGAPGITSLLGPCAVLAASGESLAAVAARIAPSVGGTILAAHDDAVLDELLLEARLHAAMPLVRDPVSTAGVYIVAVADEQRAEQLGLPVL